MDKPRLSKIISSRNSFSHVNWKLLNENVEHLTRKLNNSTKLDGLTIDVSDIHHELNKIEQSINAIKDLSTKKLEDYTNLIKENEKDYLIKSYNLYEKNYLNAPSSERKDLNKLYKHTEYYDEIENKINQMTSWTFPGLLLNPDHNDGQWVNSLVACDPLYLVDEHQDILKETLDKFNENYQKRLRTYDINYHNYDLLPNNQFGLIVAINYFEFIPYSVQKDIFQKLFELLRPGGTILFSYNNCEMSGSCILTEQNLRCYMTKSRLLFLTEGLGFSIIECNDRYPNFSYAIIKKPGTLTHNRAGQTLGKILQTTETNT